MRVFIYEFVTGGGWYSHSQDAPPEGLAGEGRAMRDALAEDFAALEGARIDVVHDVRFGEARPEGVELHAVDSAEAERRTVERLAAAADWTVVVAPEFDGHLFERARWVERAGGRLLGPSMEVIGLCSDKQATAEHLAAHGIAVPRGIALAAGDALPEEFGYPAVLKPRDGAGSLGIERFDDWPTGRMVEHPLARLETFCPGRAVSVACLCGPGKVLPLEPCAQHLADDFEYQGGSLPLEPEFAARARRLAARAAESLPGAVGYVGVDLVLGDDAGGERDFVIEINPRLTTSYVGLRACAEANLAATMIAVAEGRDVRLCWKSRGIHFTSSGSVRASLPGHP